MASVPFERKSLKLIHPLASACIDTSDGIFQSLESLAEASGVGYHILQIPLIHGSQLIARMLGIPAEMLYLGECGEYELLFTIPQQQAHLLEREAKKQGLRFFCIGEIKPSGQKIIHTLDGNSMEMENTPGRARDAGDIRIWL